MSKQLNVTSQASKLLSKIHSITYLGRRPGLHLKCLDSLEFLVKTQQCRKADLQSTHLFLFSTPFHTVRTSHIDTQKLQNACPSYVHIMPQTTTVGTRTCNADAPWEDTSPHSPKNGQGIPESWVPSVCGHEEGCGPVDSLLYGEASVQRSELSPPKLRPQDRSPPACSMCHWLTYGQSS